MLMYYRGICLFSKVSNGSWSVVQNVFQKRFYSNPYRYYQNKLFNRIYWKRPQTVFIKDMKERLTVKVPPYFINFVLKYMTGALLNSFDFSDLKFLFARNNGHDFFLYLNYYKNNYIRYLNLRLLYFFHENIELFEGYFDVYFPSFDIYFNDYRFWATAELFSEEFNLDVIFKFKRFKILLYNNFVLKIDFYSFSLLKRLTEYFRLFKYNEYIIYNMSLSNYKKYSHFVYFIQYVPQFYYYAGYFSFKRSLFFNRILLFKVFYSKPFYKFADVFFAKDIIITSSFLRFFLALHLVSGFLKEYVTYLSFYSTTNMLFYTYKCMAKGSKKTQLIPLFALELVLNPRYDNRLIINNFYWFSAKFFKRKLFNNINFYNYNFINFLTSDLLKFDLFTQLIFIMFNDFIDEWFFFNMLQFDVYSINESLYQLKIMFYNRYLDFITMYVDFNFSTLLWRFRLEHFLWSIYRFNTISQSYGYFYNNLFVFLNKVYIDNIMTYYREKFSEHYSKFCLSMFKLGSYFRYFLLFFSSKEFFIKVYERHYNFFHLNIVYFFYQYLYFLRQIYFRRLRGSRMRLMYVKSFCYFFFKYEFNYLDYYVE